jgi:hypothetical protein
MPSARGPPPPSPSSGQYQLTTQRPWEPQCPTGRPRGMRPDMPCCAPGTALLLAACAAMAAGCATGPGTAVSPKPWERAITEAAAILRAFVVPPGAQRLQQAPDSLKVPITTVVSTTLVDDVSFWRAPGQPQAVLAWEQAHLSRRFTPGDEDFGPPSWDRTFSLSPRARLEEVAGVLRHSARCVVDRYAPLRWSWCYFTTRTADRET